MSVLMIGYHRGTKFLMVLWLISTLITTMKTKQAIKYILKHPELFTEGELSYVKRVKEERKLRKLKRKHESSDSNISNT